MHTTDEALMHCGLFPRGECVASFLDSTYRKMGKKMPDHQCARAKLLSLQRLLLCIRLSKKCCSQTYNGVSSFSIPSKGREVNRKSCRW